jgi:hypothetical protein
MNHDYLLKILYIGETTQQGQTLQLNNHESILKNI